MINPIKNILAKLNDACRAMPSSIVMPIILVLAIAAISVIKRFD